jgi:hypothetical protein
MKKVEEFKEAARHFAHWHKDELKLAAAGVGVLVAGTAWYSQVLGMPMPLAAFTTAGSMAIGGTVALATCRCSLG